MAISKESKQAIKQQIEILHAQKKIAESDLTKAEKQKDKFQARVDSIASTITKLEADLV